MPFRSGAKTLGEHRARVKASKAKKAPLNTFQRKQVKAIVKGGMETKRVAWYQSYSDRSTNNRATGARGDAGFALQAASLLTNNLDMLRLIPNVTEGTADFQRIGQRIRPVSLKVDGHLRISIPVIVENQGQHDIRVTVLVLQHRQFKDYQTTYANNNFAQLLDDQQGGTNNFAGTPPNEGQRVADQYYTVVVRKVITLRYGGITAFPVGGLPPQVTSGSSVANAHNYYAKFSLNLTKHIPKVLMYPEDTPVFPILPEFQNAPTNSSLFMCVPYLDQQINSQFVINTTPVLQQYYTANMGFKDA